jgi:radical SAM superfamily enzyme YgiQ (UPF0313 family)
VLRQAKAFNSEIFSVLGGHHPSLMPKDCNDACVDSVVIGEGEKTIVELLAEYENSGNLSSINGIAYRDKDGNFKINPPRGLTDMNVLPALSRNLTRRYRKKTCTTEPAGDRSTALSPRGGVHTSVNSADS